MTLNQSKNKSKPPKLQWNSKGKIIEFRKLLAYVLLEFGKSEFGKALKTILTLLDLSKMDGDSISIWNICGTQLKSKL